MNSFFLFLKTIRAERFFLVVSLFFGLLFLFLTPPFQVPDEPNHFFRAWQVSQGGLISQKYDNRVGGVLPSSLEKIVQPFNAMVGAKDKKLSSIGLDSLLRIPVNAGETKFYDFNNTAMYSPVCYLPAALAIAVVKPFGSTLLAFYAARLAMLLFWIGAVFMAIKRIPIYKWLFTFLALLPMSLFINMSISADVVTNAICFLFIATVLKCAYDLEEPTAKQILFLCGLAFLLVSVKSVYAPLLMLVALIPVKKFKTTKAYFVKLSAPLLVGALFFLLWSALLNPLYLPYEKYNPGYRDRAALINGADMNKQMHQILHGGDYIGNVAIKTIHDSFDMYFDGYVGMFGWLENSLSRPFIVLMYILALIISFSEGERGIHMQWWQRPLIGFTFILVVFLIFLSQLLIWCYVGTDVVLNMQGRYFIPCVPLLCMLFYNRALPIKKIVPGLTILSVLLSLSHCVEILYARYH